jgi:bifunctional DNA-binding transcriptional regulator/antitoxin component of YhaV-PrlF toxin-antitoxin module
MLDTATVQIGKRGVMTFPKRLRDTYDFKTGEQFTLLDIGGVFILSPIRSQIDVLAEQIKYTLVDQGESLESMLAVLREEREKYDAAS